MRSSLPEVVDIPTHFTRRSNGFVVSIILCLFADINRCRFVCQDGAAAEGAPGGFVLTQAPRNASPTPGAQALVRHRLQEAFRQNFKQVA
jgi:hypothetical protein